MYAIGGVIVVAAGMAVVPLVEIVFVTTIKRVLLWTLTTVD